MRSEEKSDIPTGGLLTLVQFQEFIHAYWNMQYGLIPIKMINELYNA